MTDECTTSFGPVFGAGGRSEDGYSSGQAPLWVAWRRKRLNQNYLEGHLRSSLGSVRSCVRDDIAYLIIFILAAMTFTVIAHNGVVSY
jgi:hypothetical protein